MSDEITNLMNSGTPNAMSAEAGFGEVITRTYTDDDLAAFAEEVNSIGTKKGRAARWKDILPRDARTGDAKAFAPMIAAGIDMSESEIVAKFKKDRKQKGIDLRALAGGGNGSTNSRPSNTDVGEGGSVEFVSFDELIYVLGEDKIISRFTQRPVSPQSLAGGLIPSAEWEEYTYVGEDGEEQTGSREPATSVRMGSRGRRAHSVIRMPGEPEFIKDMIVKNGQLLKSAGKIMFNTYTPPPEIDDSWAGDASMWRTHGIEGLGEAAFKHLERRMAYQIQNTGSKINGIPILCGTQGDGKDMWYQPMVRYYGGACVDITVPELASGFNSYFNYDVGIIGEFESADVSKFEVYRQTKPLAATPPDFVSVNEKGKIPLQSKNSICVWGSSNDPYSLAIPIDDRRLELHEFDRSRADRSEKYFTKFGAWLKENWKAVIHHLNAMDVSDFNPMAPALKTDLKVRVITLGEAAKVTEADDYLEKFINHLATSGEHRAIAYRKMGLLTGGAEEGYHLHAMAMSHFREFVNNHPGIDENKWSPRSNVNRKLVSQYGFNPAGEKEKTFTLENKVKVRTRIKSIYVKSRLNREEEEQAIEALLRIEAGIVETDSEENIRNIKDYRDNR